LRRSLSSLQPITYWFFFLSINLSNFTVSSDFPVKRASVVILGPVSVVESVFSSKNSSISFLVGSGGGNFPSRNISKPQINEFSASQLKFVVKSRQLAFDRTVAPDPVGNLKNPHHIISYHIISYHYINDIDIFLNQFLKCDIYKI
jgi:hypothetical protein